MQRVLLIYEPFKRPNVEVIQNALLLYQEKAVTINKDRNFGVLTISILYFFILGGPLVSRQVVFFANISPLFCLKNNIHTNMYIYMKGHSFLLLLIG